MSAEGQKFRVNVFALTKNNELTTDLSFFSAYILGPAWIALAFVLLYRYRARALWVLIGFPFAFFSTGLFSLIWMSCAFGHDCI